MFNSKAHRGLATLDATKRAEISAAGGRAAHAAGTAHEYDRDEAIEAGRKGGLATSADRAHMVSIGRLGGLKRAANARQYRADSRTTASVEI